MFNTLAYVYGLVVDAVLYGYALYLGSAPCHLFAVTIGHFQGIYLQSMSCLKVDELCGACRVVKPHFVPVVQRVEQEHFMLAVAQVTQGVEEGVVLLGAHQGIGE